MGEPRPSTPVVAILEGSADLARLLELLARECAPHLPVRAFTDTGEAQRWVAAVEGAVVLLADAERDRGDASRAESWTSGGPVTLVALTDPTDPRAGAPGVAPRPQCLAEWRSCLARLLPAPTA